MMHNWERSCGEQQGKVWLMMLCCTHCENCLFPNHLHSNEAAQLEISARMQVLRLSCLWTDRTFSLGSNATCLECHEGACVPSPLHGSIPMIQFVLHPSVAMPLALMTMKRMMTSFGSQSHVTMPRHFCQIKLMVTSMMITSD